MLVIQSSSSALGQPGILLIKLTVGFFPFSFLCSSCNLACCCAEAGGLDAFILPMMLGSIGEVRPVQFQTPDKHYGASITLIARRSTQRIGTRHWRRGADTQVMSDLPHIVLVKRHNIADTNSLAVHEAHPPQRHC